MFMAIELKVVQNPTKKLFDSIFDAKNNPLWADLIFKGATPIANVDDFVAAAIQVNASKGLITFKSTDTERSTVSDLDMISSISKQSKFLEKNWRRLRRF